MGRLAVDREYQGQQWGAELLREALQSAVAAIELVAARALHVDAVNDAAAAFYRRFGFVSSPINPMQLMYDLRVVEASLQLPE
jgi:ribosomal protein S18 acetylase RimI-like enzyme